MQNTGLGSENKSYRVLLLLFVGVVAFSSAMKDLNQVHALTLQTGELIAQLSDAMAPADQDAILAQVDTCEQTKILVPPAPPLPAPAVPPVAPEAADIAAPALVPQTPPRAPNVPTAKPRRAVRPGHDSAEVRVLFSTGDLIEKSLRNTFEGDATLKALKAKNRRHQIWISPDGKDVLLKSLNRSINLRSAS